MKKGLIKYILFIMIMSFHQPVFASAYEDVSLFQIVLKLVFLIGIFILVIIITICGTKLIAKSYRGYSNSKYINLLDTLNISNEIKIIIINVNKKIYILSLTPNSTKIIDTFIDEEFLGKDFNDYLDKHINNHNKTDFGINKIIEKITFSKNKEDKQ